MPSGLQNMHAQVNCLLPILSGLGPVPLSLTTIWAFSYKMQQQTLLIFRKYNLKIASQLFSCMKFGTAGIKSAFKSGVVLTAICCQVLCYVLEICQESHLWLLGALLIELWWHLYINPHRAFNDSRPPNIWYLDALPPVFNLLSCLGN